MYNGQGDPRRLIPISGRTAQNHVITPLASALRFDAPAYRPVRLPRADTRLEIACALGELRRGVLSVASVAAPVFALHRLRTEHPDVPARALFLGRDVAGVLVLVGFEVLVARRLAGLQLVFSPVGLEDRVARPPPLPSPSA
ncbi:hypothetical protein JCM21900_005919 [Sporobolomyces salmonicolor]